MSAPGAIADYLQSGVREDRPGVDPCQGDAVLVGAAQIGDDQRILAATEGEHGALLPLNERGQVVTGPLLGLAVHRALPGGFNRPDSILSFRANTPATIGMAPGHPPAPATGQSMFDIMRPSALASCRGRLRLHHARPGVATELPHEHPHGGREKPFKFGAAPK